MSDHAYRTLCAAIQNLPPGKVVTVETFRDATDAAQLSGAEKAGALTRACNAGYLHAIGVAAVAEGRKFIGVEMVEDYQRVAQRRIQEARGLAVPRGDQDAFEFGESA
jgi:hypothetical protein